MTMRTCGGCWRVSVDWNVCLPLHCPFELRAMVQRMRWLRVALADNVLSLWDRCSLIAPPPPPQNVIFMSHCW